MVTGSFREVSSTSGAKTPFLLATEVTAEADSERVVGNPWPQRFFGQRDADSDSLQAPFC